MRCLSAPALPTTTPALGEGTAGRHTAAGDAALLDTPPASPRGVDPAGRGPPLHLSHLLSTDHTMPVHGKGGGLYHGDTRTVYKPGQKIIYISAD